MPRTWSDQRIPLPADCVLRELIDRRARDIPEKPFVIFGDGQVWTYSRLRTEVIEAAAAFQKLGVQQDQTVLCWLPNGPDALRVWFGLNYIGAIYVPLNLAYKGHLLEHAIGLSKATLLVCHSELVERLSAIDTSQLVDVVVFGERTIAVETPNLKFYDADSLKAPGIEPTAPNREPMPWDTQMVIYTSGTTGPSKGVLCSYLQIASCAFSFDALSSEDRNLVNLPLFHAGGTIPTYRMLIKGGSIALVDSFDTRNFWDTVRKTGSTCLTLLGSMASFLMKEPPGDQDRVHTLRTVLMIPLGDHAAEFAYRFGVSVYTSFNMSETGWPLISERNPTVRGTCGRPRRGIEARIVDDNDCEVPTGNVGELVLRSDCPWELSHGYLGDPEATARSWRNGWFHTGDGFRRDADGNYFFADRLKDSIRRRGENISSFEVESEIFSHSKVKEVAVVAVASEFEEDDVLAIIVPKSGGIDAAEMIEYLRPRMPYFMIPRYIRFMTELPKTPTAKVQKHILRVEGITPDTWDRERHGIHVKRDKLRIIG
jgi:crotonobetaine/carnitine-CoA ligase